MSRLLEAHNIRLQLGLGVRADLVAVQVERLQCAVDAERVGEGGGARVADLVAVQLERLQRVVDAERVGEAAAPASADLVVAQDDISAPLTRSAPAGGGAASPIWLLYSSSFFSAPLTRSASARAAAPASPIWLLCR